MENPTPTPDPHSDVLCPRCKIRPAGMVESFIGNGPLPGPCPECERAFLRSMRHSTASNRLHALRQSGAVQPSIARFRDIHAVIRSAPDSAKPHYRHVVRCIENRCNVFLYGPTGTGKTILARTALFRMFSSRRNTIAEVTGPALASMSELYSKPPAWSLYHMADVLLIDDIATGKWTPVTLSGLWSILDARHNGRPTLVTSNLSPEDLLNYFRDAAGLNKTLAESTLERLNPCTKIAINGPSARKRAL